MKNKSILIMILLCVHCVLLLLAASFVGAQSFEGDQSSAAELVLDINSEPLGGNPSSAPEALVGLGDWVLFTARIPSVGRELWVSDGTDEGTRLIADLLPGPLSGGENLDQDRIRPREIGGAVYFGLGGLWRTDGTPEGTVRLSVHGAVDIVAWNDTVYFFGSGGIWQSDGTAGGTLLVVALPSEVSMPEDLTPVGDQLFFTAWTEDTGRELWASDGTTVELVKDVYPGTYSYEDRYGIIRYAPYESKPAELVDVNGMLFFVATTEAGRELWRSDGTEARTVMILDIYPGTTGNSANSGYPKNLIPVGELLLFSATDGAQEGNHGRELWKSDSTPEGTNLVLDINPGPDSGVSGYADAYALMGDSMYFAAGAYVRELWKTDGTTAGTIPLASVIPRELCAVGETLFFSGEDEVHGKELWASDGTPMGTRLVKDIAPGSSSPWDLAAAGSKVFFSAGDAVHGRELWSSDGTELGTYMVKDIDMGDVGSLLRHFTSFHGELSFGAFDEDLGLELWSSDGSTEGTRIVKDIGPGYQSSLGRDGFVVLNDHLLFFADDGVTGLELWSSDGTEEGTHLVKDINPGPGDAGHRSAPLGSHVPVQYGDAVFFAANDGDHGEELWRTDGTTVGTYLFYDLDPSGDSSPGKFTVVGDTLFFTASGYLWKTDGTEAGTEQINYRSISTPWPGQLTEFDGKLFFTSYGCSPTTTSGCIRSGRELFITDGTTEGTFNFDLWPGHGSSDPRYLTVSNDRLFFSARDSESRNLWVSDGTPETTMRVTDDAPYAPYWITDVDGTLFFSAYDPIHGRELWTSDGTEAGTRLVKDIFPGSKHSNPSQLMAVRGILLFAALDGEHGIELWRSDGTEAGTFMIDDLALGPLSSSPRDFTLAGPPFVFFAASGGSRDRNEELWKLTLPELAAPDIESITLDREIVLVGESVTATVAFTDTSLPGGHTATWDWGDGTRTQGTVLESGYGGVVTGTHTYDTAGSYEVSVAIAARDGIEGTRACTVVVRIRVQDTTPPEITISSPEARDYPRSETLVIDFDVADTCSGVAWVSATLDSDSVSDDQELDLWLLPLGSHTLTVSAEDNEGNASDPVNVTFDLIATAESLDSTVEQFFSDGLIDNPGVKESLLDKLSAATKKINQGQAKAAKNILNAFINHVRAQAGKHIAPEAAEILIADAEYVVSQL